AVVVDAAGEQVVEQALLHLLELGDDLLGLADRLVQRVEDLGDLTLFGQRRHRYLEAEEVPYGYVQQSVVSNPLLRDETQPLLQDTRLEVVGQKVAVRSLGVRTKTDVEGRNDAYAVPFQAPHDAKGVSAGVTLVVRKVTALDQVVVPEIRAGHTTVEELALAHQTMLSRDGEHIVVARCVPRRDSLGDLMKFVSRPIGGLTGESTLELMHTQGLREDPA